MWSSWRILYFLMRCFFFWFVCCVARSDTSDGIYNILQTTAISRTRYLQIIAITRNYEIPPSNGFFKTIVFYCKDVWLNIMQVQTTWNSCIQLLEKSRRKKMCTRQSRKVIWDIVNRPFFNTLAVEPTFVAFLQHSQTYIRPWSLVHDSNFFEKQWI